MKEISNYIKTTKIVYPQIYSYTLPDLKENDGSQKIGYTERKDVEKRILEQTHTAAFRLKHRTLWHSPAFYGKDGDGKDFSDKDFHKFLIKSGVENRKDLGTEWFFFNGYPEKSKEFFELFCEQGFRALQNDDGKTQYFLRNEQAEAVRKTIKYFKKNKKGEFLWNAKPRFGKTLASYDLARQLDAKKVLVVTNRPAIANSWFEDYEQFVGGYAFVSTSDSLKGKATLTRDQFTSDDPGKSHITFLSLQDLKTSRYFGGRHDKLGWVADLVWDLLIIDEAHEGVDTVRTEAAFSVIKRKNTLHLSGTPFKQLANSKFPKEAIFNWTYLDEQKVKKEEAQESESGPHVNLPDLKLFTYRISEMTVNQVNEGVSLGDQEHNFVFDLNEFFSTKNKKFVYEQDVRNFLHNLSTNKKYPFSTPELRNELKHSFWYVGNRVDSVKALEELLKTDPIFKDYKVIVAAGNGRTFEEEESDFGANEKSFDRVKQAISKNEKTITLSCGQLTTGVTVKEWSAVLMLTDIKSPATYMQAAFRAQNPNSFIDTNGNIQVKKSAYLFDFAPTRVLEIYDEFANGLSDDAVKGKLTQSERHENIEELLNFFPVISEDTEGEMIELDTDKVLTFPNAIAAAEIVKARFMSNLLFNDNIKGVFNLPSEAAEIVNKLSVEKNKRVEKPKEDIDFESGKELNNKKTHNINQNTELILGQKVYATNLERIVNNALDENNIETTITDLPQAVQNLADPLIAKTKEIYKLNSSEFNEKKKQATEKIKAAVAEYESSEIKDAKQLTQNLKHIMEHDLVINTVIQKADEEIEKVRKTQEEEIRDRLRSFTRTIPMFVMANSSNKEVTIDNFDQCVSDSDFEDLTSITKEEFHKLRNGFDYEENGERKTFEGVFNKYRFNASIAEFVKAKKDKSNYFESQEDIFELIPNQKTNQIFTPRAVVRMMIDGLEREDPSLFERTDSTFIDLYMKSGMYITEIVKKLFANTRNKYKSDAECLRHILENQVYGLAPTNILQDITRAYIFGFDTDGQINRRNFINYDLVLDAQDNTVQEKLQELFNLNKDMKFDAVVGNPPYQISLDNNKMSRSVYPDFMKSAKNISRVVSLVMPARWMSGESGPYRETKNFINEILDGSHLRSFTLYPDSNELFSGVDIKGGVCYFVWDKNYRKDLVDYVIKEGGEIYSDKVPLQIMDNIIIRIPQLVNVVQKISIDSSEKSMRGLVSPWNPFGFVSDLFTKNNEEVSRISESQEQVDDFKVIGLFEKKRTYRYIPNIELKKNIDIAKSWKVFVTRANGSGKFGETFSSPMVAEPMLVCTDTFLQIGKFDNKFEAESVLKYIKTKFFRAMIGVRKTAVFNYRDTFSSVPVQDFSKKSDIDWTKSITEIDQQLYKKYKLVKKEIEFIEKKVQPMS